MDYYLSIQPNKTKEGLQFIWDTVPNSDDPRNPLSCLGGGGFSATAIIACDPNAAVDRLTIDSVSKISCNFNIKMRSEAACKPKPFVPIPIANNDEPWGWFSIFCFTLFIGFLLYFTLGTVYMYRQKGYAEIPHKSFWERSFFRCKSCCMSIVGRSSDGGGTTTYNEFGTSNSSSSNMNNRFSNTYNTARHENTVVYDDL